VIIEKKIAHAQAEESDRDRHDQGGGDAGRGAHDHRPPVDPALGEQNGHAIGADAEKHRMPERDDAGIAEHEIVARHQDYEDADARGDPQRLSAGEQEGREHEDGQHHDHVQQQATRRIIGDEPAHP
jgi:hypothetical protein